MTGTILATLAALFFHWQAFGHDATLNQELMVHIVVVSAVVFLILPFMIYSFALMPLERAESRASHVISLFKRDNFVRFNHAILILFVLFSIALSVGGSWLLNKSIVMIFTIWIIFLGVAIDALWGIIGRITSYSEPTYLIDQYMNAAQKAIQKGEEKELCLWIDSSAEVAVKALDYNRISITNQVADEIQQISRLFFASSKSISQPAADTESKELGIADKVSYTLFFILQRFDMINDKAVEKKLEPVVSNLIKALGKITIYAAECDISLATYPLPFIGKISVKGQQAGLTEVGPKSAIVLVQVAKGILDCVDVTYIELQETYFSLINQLHEVTKEMFRQNKNISLKLLVKPFFEIKELFTTEKMANHPDSGPILEKIESVLAEYHALQEVLSTRPPIPL